MPVEKAVGPGGNAEEDISSGLGMDLVLPADTGAEVTPTEDGGAIVQLGPEEPTPLGDEGFDSNLAEFMSETDLSEIGRKLVELVDIDDRSRSDWKRTYIKGLDLLGFKIEDRTDPWSGACGVFHPVMTEAVVRFQSQAIMEIFPASGPVKTKIIGKWSREKEDQAKRVQQELNYFICDKMTEFRPETETLLFYLALAGSAFRKTFYCPELGRPMGRFVPAEDFIVPYGTTDLKTCPRYTEVMRMFPNDLRKLQVSGFYLDIELPKPEFTQSEVKEKYDKLDGRSRNASTDERYEIYEVHADWNLPGYEDTTEIDGEVVETGVELPYVFTVDKSSQKVLAIRRNWEESDPERIKRCHYTPYHYLPGLGFYGSGLIHLIGGITSSATSILRQLVDAGTLSNLPGGLKSRGMRIKGDDSPIMPGEFRDVDVPSGAIRDNITFIPYKEPSQVLHSLLGDMIAEGRRLGAAPDLPINAMTQQAPVGTTLALLERSMKVMSAVQARLHASLKEDYWKIADIIRKDMGVDYEYEPATPGNRQEDFEQVDIIPVSDPNASSMAQRVVQMQAAMEIARQDPTAFDLPEMYREAFSVLGMQNVSKIVKDPENIQPMDPVSENMAIITGKPVKAFMWQDHEAHIQVHMNAAQDPKILQMVGQSPMASKIQGEMAAHISEHLAFAYRRGIEEKMGVPLPPPEEPLPEDVEVQLSKAVAEASQRLLQSNQAEAAQKKAQQLAEDPVFQLQKQEVENDRLEIERKAKKDQMDGTLKVVGLAQKEAAERRRLESQERVAGAALGVKIGEARTAQIDSDKNRAVDTGLELLDLDQRARELRAKEIEAKERIRAQRANRQNGNGHARNN